MKCRVTKHELFFEVLDVNESRSTVKIINFRSPRKVNKTIKSEKRRFTIFHNRSKITLSPDNMKCRVTKLELFFEVVDVNESCSTVKIISFRSRKKVKKTIKSAKEKYTIFSYDVKNNHIPK